MADELGLLVLDETAVFGSSIRLNPELSEFWTRYAEHYERLIRRDRNHPSVFGWSFGNEMFAIPLLNKLSPADTAALSEVRRRFEVIRINGGSALVMVGDHIPAGLLPAEVQLTERPATALVPDREHPWTRGLTLPQLYFAEDGADRFIMRHGATGAFVDQGRVLLQASGTDWSLFNNVPEVAKTGGTVLYEQLVKPSGAAMVEHRHGPGQIVLCLLDYHSAERFWRTLLSRMGLALRAAQAQGIPAFNDDGVLVNALGIGRFGGPDLEMAFHRDFLGPAAARSGITAGDRTWTAVTSPSKDRFVFRDLKQDGPTDVYAAYFSFWIKSPRVLDDLLLAGPEVPHLNMFCYVSRRCRLFLNDRELTPAHTEPADYRTRLQFDGLPLSKGWNHFLIKVVANQLTGDLPGTLAVRIQSNRPEYFQQLESTIELPATIVGQ